MTNQDQLSTIKTFCSGAKYYMAKFDKEGDESFGKILDGTELVNVDISKTEIHRSTEFSNGDVLFVYSLKPSEDLQVANNPLKLLINNLKEARIIEKVYPGIFRWVYDGLFLKAYAIVPASDMKSNTTITRYGGTEMFIKILNQHLSNIGKMHRGLTPDYNFLRETSDLETDELSMGSVNKFNNMYSVGIDLDSSYIDILKQSKNNIHTWQPLNILNMKYWMKEINPDFIVEAKHIKLTGTLSIDEGWKLYPPCIKKLMGLKTKGNYYRFLLARFLLSVHSAKDAKFIFDSVLSPTEREHVKSGNCSTQWNYVLNNYKRYSCPTMKDLKSFISEEDGDLSHPLERIQVYIEERDKNDSSV
jgi:hypothetical protein